VPPIAEMKAAFDRAGYLLVPALLPVALCADLCARVETIQESVPRLSVGQCRNLVFERDLPARKRGGIPPEKTGAAIFIIGDPPAFDPTFARALLDPCLLTLARLLLESDDIRYHFSNVTMKRAGIGSGISWHRDFPNNYICPSRPTALRLMLCLDGMAAESGATSFVPGSHLMPEHWNQSPSAIAERQPWKTIACPPGSVIAIHPRVVHGGSPNPTDRHRRNLIVQWGRADDLVAPPADAIESLCGLSVAEIETWLAARQA